MLLDGEGRDFDHEGHDGLAGAAAEKPLVETGHFGAGDLLHQGRFGFLTAGGVGHAFEAVLLGQFVELLTEEHLAADVGHLAEQLARVGLAELFVFKEENALFFIALQAADSRLVLPAQPAVPVVSMRVRKQAVVIFAPVS